MASVFPRINFFNSKTPSWVANLMPAGMTAENAWLADPEKYDLLRARMGGWPEFNAAIFPADQAQKRRPVESPEMPAGGGKRRS
ncbi:MAG: hypothetical protein QOC63_5077 [Mycobacterium sp.]|nr:hypothetical protein [Mycobacterium sp.]